MGSAGSPRLGQSNTARSVAGRSRSIQPRSQAPLSRGEPLRIGDAGVATEAGAQPASATVEASRPTSVRKQRREAGSVSMLILLPVRTELCGLTPGVQQRTTNIRQVT